VSRLVRASVFLLAGLLSVGCGRTLFTPLVGDPTVPLPGDAAAPTVATEFCRPGEDGRYPLAETHLEEPFWDGRLAVARGGGCLGRSLAEAYRVLRNPDALKWERAVLVGYVQLPDDRVSALFESSYVAGPSVFAQRWTMQWYHTVTADRVFVRYKKTVGTSFIPQWDGTLELVAVAPSVTAVSMRNEIEAARTGLAESADTVRDQLTRLRTVPPLPEGEGE
jgi:hypothetical protein